MMRQGRDTEHDTRIVLVNGHRSDVIPITDRGLQYGDGVFETLAVEQGVPLCLGDHLDRLTRGCRQLNIRGPARALLEDEAGIVAENLARGVLKILVSRGVGGRGYAPIATGPGTRIVAGFDWPDYPDGFREEGIEACLCKTRLGRNAGLAGIKHLNRLEQVLGRGECQARGVPEGIMSDTHGNLIEGTMSNLFLVRGNQLFTPRLTDSGVRGIVRARIIRLARTMEGLGVRASTLAPSALRDAHEVFFCNSLIGIWPVRRLENHAYPIGPIARRLWAELTKRRVIPI
uniref:Aminodeoxychorismate lyase n=1 Tax=Candidatus Kentrum eta TaxID=2126337 RepID=A0A450U9H0_9GAMM|nr:MAG: aminodeoxychorismate lyase apoprotein [Candidatus Kentron sp. H]VFJ90767.1 MAG: aminodeoxychorismate lyase apoprotein [Candidatus Kentron sp. H]VFJ96901.1 MAG: aminodeoxychorismate lyase apoprotein [Candidatus Kentron sp. H]